jgi:hypothetical protein
MAAYVPITTDFLNTPRRKVEAAVGSKTSAMLALPAAPVEKNGLVPMTLVVKDNGALVVEVEKVNVKLDEVKAILMLGFAEVDSPAPVAEVDSAVAVPPVDMAVTHTLMMRQCDEMRRVMASEQEKTRVFIRNWAIFMVGFIFAMAIVVSNVYMLKEPAVCESPAEALPTVYDNMRCCARVFAKDTY